MCQCCVSGDMCYVTPQPFVYRVYAVVSMFFAIFYRNANFSSLPKQGGAVEGFQIRGVHRDGELL